MRVAERNIFNQASKEQNRKSLAQFSYCNCTGSVAVFLTDIAI
jgi:hypothetical protein